MKRCSMLLLTAAASAIVVWGCGPAGNSEAENTAGLVPERIGTTGWIRAPEMEYFAGDSLFEYIDGAAEMYHKYDFVDVTVATYLKDDKSITADLYLFEQPDRAFGMYTTLRPDEPDTVSLGVEGFAFGPNLVFVRGPYLVNVYTYDDFDRSRPAVRAVAQALESRLPGATDMPGMFRLFPKKGRIAFTEKIFAEGFLGRGFLTDVYVVTYSIDDRRVRLFIAEDPAAEKFNRWLDVAGAGDRPAQAWLSEIFGEGRSLEFDDDYHGEIVAGWRGGKLVGVVGFVQAYKEDFLDWTRSLE